MLDSHFKVKERLKKSRDQLYFSQKRNTSAQNRNDAATIAEKMQMQITKLKWFPGLLSGEHVSFEKFTNSNVFLKEMRSYCLFFNE